MSASPPEPVELGAPGTADALTGPRVGRDAPARLTVEGAGPTGCQWEYDGGGRCGVEAPHEAEYSDGRRARYCLNHYLREIYSTARPSQGDKPMNEVERLHDEIRSLRVKVSGLRIERERLLRALNHEERSRLGYHGPDCAIQRGAACDCETQQYHRAVGTANILRRQWQELAEALGTDEERVVVVARELAARAGHA